MATPFVRRDPTVVAVTHGRGLSGLDAIAAPWRTLAAGDAAGPLAGPDWIRALVASHGQDAALHLFSASQDGRVTAVLPLLLRRGWLRGWPLRKLSAPVDGTTLRFDLVAAPGEPGQTAIQALWEAVSGWPDWTMLELGPMPEAGGAERLLACAAAAGYPAVNRALFRSPCLDLARGLDAVLAAASANFRHKLRRTRRRLLEQGPLRLELVARPGAGDLEAFFRLEAAGWKGRKGGKAVLRRSAQQQRFYQELVTATLAQGQCTLHRLRLGDRVLAASLGLIGGQTYYAVRWCYDEQFAAFGPGHLLIESLLQECERLGLRTFDFTGPEYPYKRDWTATALPHSCCNIFRPDWRGRALYRWKSLPRSLRA